MAISLGGFSGGGAGAVSSVNGQTGVVVVSGDDITADHSASHYTASNSNIDGHLSGIDSKLGTLASGLSYKGTFNATAGTPSLANAEQGDLYVIDTAGTIYGVTWAIGDHLLINADMGGSISNSKIDKIDNTDQVTSVNGNTGAVTLSGDDLTADHSASHYTASNSNIDGHLSGIDSKFGTLATVATSGAYSDLSGTPSLATVATTGAYSDLSGTPSLATVATSGAYSDLSGLPTLGTASASATTDFLASTAGLDDLSDVSYTAGAGIDNYVLTYDHSTTSWGAEVVPSAPVTSVNGNTGAVTLSGDDLTADHSASHYTPANSNIDGHLSGIDSKFGTLATVATSGAYSDLSGTPSLATVATSGAYSDLSGTPSLGTASASAATDFLSATGADSLGGDLDTNDHELISNSNKNVTIRPNGTGIVKLGGNTNPAELRFYCETTDQHYIGFKAPTHSELSGKSSISWRLPLEDASSSGDALVSDGAGNLSFTTISGGGGYTYSAITATTTAQLDYHYSCGAGNETFTVNLPAVSGGDAGKSIRVKNMGTGTITIDGNSSSTIDGQTTITLDVQFSSVTLVATGNASASWEIV